MTNFKSQSQCTAFSRPIDAGQLLRRQQGGLSRQWTARLVSLRVPQVPRSNTDPHVVAECPQPLARLHVLGGNSSGARQTTISRGCSGQRAELPSRRCGSRSRVGPKHFRCPRQRSSTVSVRPTHLPTPPPKAMAHQADFPCALSAVPTAQIFQGPGHSGVF